MFGFLKKLLGGSDAAAGSTPAGTLTVEELSRRLGIPEPQLRSTVVAYQLFKIPKRTGGARTISVPSDPLKAIQRTILRKLLSHLRCHACATGFERGHSIVTNANFHVGRDAIVKLDIQDFFGSTTSQRIDAYFRRIGWNADAAALLTNLCTYQGALPQGAPTSPRLSNLVNHLLDARLAGIARKHGMAYTRYADDITVSVTNTGSTPRINGLIASVKNVVSKFGYKLHTKKKLRIARRADRQIVTGLVVNQKVNLPRRTRRRLRAAEHHLKTGKPATFNAAQLAGWKSLRAMVDSQRKP